MGGTPKSIPPEQTQAVFSMQRPASVAMESVLAAIKGAGPVYGGIYATRTDFIREIYAGPAVPFRSNLIRRVRGENLSGSGGLSWANSQPRSSPSPYLSASPCCTGSHDRYRARSSRDGPGGAGAWLPFPDMLTGYEGPSS